LPEKSLYLTFKIIIHTISSGGWAPSNPKLLTGENNEEIYRIGFNSYRYRCRGICCG
jgi:hypothetical protein